MLIWQSRAARPGVGQHVRELVLAGASNAAHANLSVGLLLQFLHALPNLRVLTLEHIQLSWVAMHCAAERTGRHRYLDKLCLADIHSPTRPCLAPLVGLFPDIGTLCVRDFKDAELCSLFCRESNSTEWLDGDVVIPSRVRALEIKECGRLATMACMFALHGG